MKVGYVHDFTKILGWMLDNIVFQATGANPKEFLNMDYIGVIVLLLSVEVPEQIKYKETFVTNALK